jgi:hypothetical protein
MTAAIYARQEKPTWRAPYLDLASGLFVPQPVTWDPGDRRIHARRRVEGVRDVGGGGGGVEVSAGSLMIEEISA